MRKTIFLAVTVALLSLVGCANKTSAPTATLPETAETVTGPTHPGYKGEVG